MSTLPVPGGGGDRHQCAHCDKVVSAKRSRKPHMVACASLPPAVREALDRAAVRACRAQQGQYGGENRAVYRRFRVTGAGVASCKACGGVVMGDAHNLKKHLERACGGIKVTWAVVGVGEQFAAVRGGGDRHRCAHCDKVVTAKRSRKPHMAACASLPPGVREALDHAAVCVRAEQSWGSMAARTAPCTAASA